MKIKADTPRAGGNSLLSLQQQQLNMFDLVSYPHSPPASMRKLWPNLERDDGLETVLEVPIPEEIFDSNLDGSSKNHLKTISVVSAWLSSRSVDPYSSLVPQNSRATELQFMLGVVGAPLVPLPIQTYKANFSRGIKEDLFVASMAKYIVKQYIAAVGGEKAINSIESMYAMGKVEMRATEFPSRGRSYNSDTGKNKKSGQHGEMGGFVLWQKKPELWCLELVVSGCKITAGSDGKMAWRQTPWHNSHSSRGPPRPLRRSLQGLDPRSTASLFSNSVCVGEKKVNDEDCFVLRFDAEASTLRARSSIGVEIIRHTVWGYFSQRSGLMVHLLDSHLLCIHSQSSEKGVYWETIMESSIQDYRPVDGVLIAHGGHTNVSLARFVDGSTEHTTTRMEEVWSIEEVDFNIFGLSNDCFLPPAELKESCDGPVGRPSFNLRSGSMQAVATVPQAVEITFTDDEDSEES